MNLHNHVNLGYWVSPGYLNAPMMATAVSDRRG
jgi:hypothetical protein